MSEFAQNPNQRPSEPVVLSGATEFDTGTTAPPTAEGLAAQAAAVAGSPTALAPTAATPQNTAQPAGSPSNMNAAPEEPKSKLLTPEEKARVIAELEALARGQGASAPAAKATSSECDPDAAQELDPADRLNADPAAAEC